MFAAHRACGFLLAGLLLAGAACSGGGNRNRGGDDNNANTGDLVPGGGREAASQVRVVPRSVGGGISEAEASFAVERETLQVAYGADQRLAASHALRFLQRARRRFRRALRVARRIQNARLTDLPEGVQEAAFRVTTPAGQEVCLRLSTAPFAPDAGSAPVGGARLDALLEEASDPLSLRVWVDRACRGDFERFYASILERRPDEAQDLLEEEDDSSAGAWSAGRGCAWLIPGSLLGEDVDYRASACWDHTTDPRRTIYRERGRITPQDLDFEVDLEFARYVVVREETTGADGQPLICKKLHATGAFRDHPTLQGFDVRAGVCFSAGEEGRAADRLRISGSFTRQDGTVVAVDGCFGQADDDHTADCGAHLEILDLQDDLLLADPVGPDSIVLPDDSFGAAPATDSEVADLGAPAGDGANDNGV